MIKMFKENWKELIIVGLVYYTLIGMFFVMLITPLRNFVGDAMEKILTNGEGYSKTQLKEKGVPCFDKDGTPIMVHATPKNQEYFDVFTLIMFCAGVITLITII
jgi:hypothetical protein